jgi:hypothetical protein
MSPGIDPVWGQPIATGAPTGQIDPVTGGPILAPTPGPTDPNLQYLPSDPLTSLYNWATGKLTSGQVAYVTSQSATVTSPALATPAKIAQVQKDTAAYLASPQAVIPGSLPYDLGGVGSGIQKCNNDQGNPCNAWDILTASSTNNALCQGCPFLTTFDEIIIAATGRRSFNRAHQVRRKRRKMKRPLAALAYGDPTTITSRSAFSSQQVIDFQIDFKPTGNRGAYSYAVPSAAPG